MKDVNCWLARTCDNVPADLRTRFLAPVVLRLLLLPDPLAVVSDVGKFFFFLFVLGPPTATRSSKLHNHRASNMQLGGKKVGFA